MNLMCRSPFTWHLPVEPGTLPATNMQPFMTNTRIHSLSLSLTRSSVCLAYRGDMLVQRVVKMMTKRWGAAMPDSSLSLRLFPPHSHIALYGVCWGGPDQPPNMTVRLSGMKD